MIVELVAQLAAALFLFAPPPDSAFEPWFEEKGVAVARAMQPQRPLPWIRGVAELDAPPAEIARVLGDYAGYEAIFEPILESVRVLEAQGDTARVHLVWAYPFPLRDRDAIVAHRLVTRPDGSVLLECSGDPREGDPQTGVRIATVEGRTEVLPREGGGSRVVYTYYGDLGGDFGRGGNERAWRGQPVHYVESLRRALAGR